MSAGDVTIIAPGSIQGDDTKPFARAKSILNGAGVMSTTNRDLIHADVKLGGYLIYNTTTSQLEWWNGSAWVAVGTGSGGGMGFRFTYSTTTTDADPTAGTFRGNNVTLSSVTQLYVDIAEYGGTDVTAWLDSFDDYAGSIKGVIRLSSQSDPTKWIEYTMTAWTTATGYRKLTVAYKDGPGGLLTTAGDTFFAFDYASAGFTGGTSVTVSAAGAVARAALTGDVTASADSNATTIANNAVTTVKINAAAVTGPKLVAGDATGQQILWDGSSWLKVGTLSAVLADASVTIQFGTASQYIWPASVDSASARNLTFGNTGLAAGPMAGQAAVMSILFLRASHTSAITVRNIATATIFTLPAALGKPLVARFYYDTTAADWALAGWDYLGTVTAA